MIESIELKEFQAHKNTKIDLHKGINAIIGGSTSGKSSIFRAINWIYSNTPRGDSIVNYGNRTKTGGPKNETSACVVTNGHSIKRIKDSSRNGYDIDKEELGAIGSGVPEKITNALNLSDISFQSQHSPHFLLSQSSGEVATFLNTVLNLSVIDEVLGKVNEKTRASKRKQEATNEEIVGLGKQLGKLDYLDVLVPLVGNLNQVHVQKEATDSKRNALHDTISRGLEISDRQDQGQKYVAALRPAVDAVESVLSQSANNTAKYNELKAMVVQFDAISAVIAKDTMKLSMIPLCDQADTLVTKKKDVVDKAGQLSRIIESIRVTRETIAKNEDRITELKGKLPDTCPVCGGKL